MEIVLIRHGQPTLDKNMKLSSSGFRSWLTAYNNCPINPECKPPKSLKKYIEQHFVVSSNLPRAINSATLCLGKKPDLIESQLEELSIPQWSLPVVVNAYWWIVLNGLAWCLGFNGKEESLTQGRKRAKSAVSVLVEMAQKKQQVAVFGHVIMNYFIAFELLRNGWQAKCSGKKFWSTLVLTSGS